MLPRDFDRWQHDRAKRFGARGDLISFCWYASRKRPEYNPLHSVAQVRHGTREEADQ
jgi:hypothetical protein